MLGDILFEVWNDEVNFYLYSVADIFPVKTICYDYVKSHLNLNVNAADSIEIRF